MSIDSETTTPPRTGSPRALAWAVLVASVLEVIAPVITLNGPGSSPGNGSGPELLITPVGWAFSIWGVIYLLAIAQAVAVLVVGSDALSKRLQIDQLVLYLGGALWIVCAGLDSSLATASALLVMFVAAVDAALTVARETMAPRWFALLTRGAVGLYAGWVTAAFFLNLSTALVDAGAAEADTLPWQLAMLVVAALVLLALIVATRGLLTFTAAGAWALLGITVTGLNDDTTEVSVIASTAAVALLAATMVVRLTGEQSRDLLR